MPNVVIHALIDRETNRILANTMPHSMNIFYHNGRWWVFYFTSDYVYSCKSSADDGVTWSSVINLDLYCYRYGDYVSAVLDSTNNIVHFASTRASIVSYRAAYLNSNGTVTYPYASTLFDDGNLAAEPPVVNITTNGLPFFSYTRISSLYWRYMKVYLSSTRDGQWTPYTNFPYSNFSDLWPEGYSILAMPRSSGGITAYWRTNYDTDLQLRYKHWGSGSWGSDINTTILYPNNRWAMGIYTPSGTAFFYYMNSAGSLVHANWATGVHTTITSSFNTVPQCRYSSIDNSIYAFWVSGISVYSRRYKLSTSTWYEPELVYSNSNIVNTSPVYVAIQPGTGNLLLVWLKTNGTKFDLVCNRNTLPIIPVADARVSSIRHKYSPGVYSMKLGLGKLGGLYNYQDQFDLLKLDMRKSSIETAAKQIAKENK